MRSFYRYVFIVLCSAICTAANAGSIGVNPIRATLSTTHPVSALTVQNDGTEPAVIQLGAWRWTQENGKDIYAPTSDILATPPIFTLQPGTSQLVRVGLRRTLDARQEMSYRLYLQEVPSAAKSSVNGLQVSLRVGIPVFVLPSINVSPGLNWRASEVSRGQIKITANNAGNAHIQVANFKLLQAPSVTPLHIQQTAAYLMPGQSRDWLVKLDPRAGTPLRLAAETDAGNLESELPIRQP